MTQRPMRTFFFHGFSGGGGQPLAPFARQLGLDMDNVVLLDMPGFKNSDGLLDQEILADPEAYEQMAEPAILQLRKSEKIRVIAYSHGAIPAFLFAARHQDIVAQLILICPAASMHPFVSLLPKVMGGVVRIAGMDRTLRFMRRRYLVDAMTLYGRKRYWDHDMLASRLRTRREEADEYNTNMYYLMKQLETFQKQCSDVRIEHIPTVILRATDDEVIGRNSVQWFRDHIAQTKIVSTIGGHAILAVMPEKAAERLIPFLETGQRQNTNL